MMSLGFVKQNDCTLWTHQLEAFPNRDTIAEGTSWDLSLNYSQSLVLSLWTRGSPLLPNTREPWASQAASYNILGLLWPFFSLLLPSFIQCIYSTNMHWEPTLFMCWRYSRELINHEFMSSLSPVPTWLLTSWLQISCRERTHNSQWLVYPGESSCSDISDLLPAPSSSLRPHPLTPIYYLGGNHVAEVWALIYPQKQAPEMLHLQHLPTFLSILF